MSGYLVEEEQKSVQQVVPACPHIQLLVTNLGLKKKKITVPVITCKPVYFVPNL
jgi:hypothetical protein